MKNIAFTTLEHEDPDTVQTILNGNDHDRILELLIRIKNAVIGSNRQKNHAMRIGCLPALLALAAAQTKPIEIRNEALIVINSLAKGTDEQIDQVLGCGTAETVLKIIDEDINELIAACLRLLRTFIVSGRISIDIFDSQNVLKSLLKYGGSDQEFGIYSCVVTIFSRLPRSDKFAKLLVATKASFVLCHSLLTVNPGVLNDAIVFYSNMFYENYDSVWMIHHTKYKDDSLLALLSKVMQTNQSKAIQLEAANCLTIFFRANAIRNTSRIVLYETLPKLIQLIECKNDEIEIAIRAAYVLVYLLECDSSLQGSAATIRHLIPSLADLMIVNRPECKAAAFQAFAVIGSNNECVRTKIIETDKLMEEVLQGLSHDDQTVRIAAIRCLHSLSRSVQQLRTTFQDHLVWKPLMAIWNSDPPPSIELMTVTSSTLCNLLLEFSPAKEPIVELGAVELLSSLTDHPDTALRLNGIWALMNMAFCADQRLKVAILQALGTDKVFVLLADHSEAIVMKTLGLLRNLLSTRPHIDLIMTSHAPSVLHAIIMVLEGSHAADIKEQAICILGNIADGANGRECIMRNDDLLKKLVNYMQFTSSTKLQAAAIFSINNLALKTEPNFKERQQKLAGFGVISILEKLISTTNDPVLYENLEQLPAAPFGFITYVFGYVATPFQ